MNKTVQDIIAEAKKIVPSISCGEYTDLRETGTHHVLLDVREKDEWEKGHIDGATHIPRGLLEFKIAELVPDQETLIITQCASGGRGALCGRALLELGYTNVKNLEGGYTAYCQEKSGE